MSTSAVTYQCCLHFNGEDMIPFILTFHFLKILQTIHPCLATPRNALTGDKISDYSGGSVS